MSGRSSIVIRDIETIAEVRAVEEMQKHVWGVPDLDVVPLSQLAAARASGGVLLGAFDREVLAGFAYGFVGLERGKTVHHSHMLAVWPEYRGHDLGFRLKCAQRDRVLEQGIDEMTWTFDPLQSLNAYFNFGKLGVVSDTYLVNFYGEDAASFLHRNGTDRLWVRWHLSGGRVAEQRDRKASTILPLRLSTLVELRDDKSPIFHDLGEMRAHDRLSIEIPANIGALEGDNMELAREWRLVTRRAFGDALAAGFVVQDFHRKAETSNPTGGCYVLERKID